MAIPWLVVLQNVPWTEVLRNAPKVADAAKKLWRSVSRRDGATPAPDVPVVRADAAPSERLAQLETTVVELHGQMQAASELIRALADQNTELVTHMQATQVRLRRLTAALGVLAIAVVALVWQAWH